jgi:hypothetical protein
MVTPSAQLSQLFTWYLEPGQPMRNVGWVDRWIDGWIATDVLHTETNNLFH